MTFRLLLSGHDTIECAYYLAPELGCLLDYERQAAEKKAPRQSKSRNSKAIKLGSESFCWPDTPRVGIDNFRWHDLRHTWASWHVQAGTPLHVLQELGGWESAEMVRRYAQGVRPSCS